ncbi:MAG: hypothetical protein AB7G93_04510 [Bdellovibrionales bacterium]
MKFWNSVFILFFGMGAQASTVLNCTQNGDANKPALVLSVDDEETYTLELIDPTALQPLVHLKLWPNAVTRSSRIIAVDHWESFVGAVQLIAVYDAGSFKSKHVYFDASFGLDADNHGSTGLQQLNALSAAGIKWVCEEDPL